MVKQEIICPAPRASAVIPVTFQARIRYFCKRSRPHDFPAASVTSVTAFSHSKRASCHNFVTTTSPHFITAFSPPVTSAFSAPCTAATSAPFTIVLPAILDMVLTIHDPADFAAIAHGIVATS